MMRRIVFFLLIFAFCILAAEQVVIRFDDVTPEIINTFNEPDYDVASYKPGEYLDIVVDINEYENLLSSGYSVRITQTEAKMRSNLHGSTDLAGYMDYDEMLAELQQIEIDNPSICKLYDIGESRGKQYSDAGNSNYDEYYHEIWALKVSDNVETEEDEPGIYYLAEHHAREPISLEVTMEVLRHILENYGTDPEITENVDNTQIWFVPLVNPNGHKIVTEEIYTMWRKNIRDNNENGSIDVTGYYASDGVDPNRNYSYMWGGASNNWTSETYQGPIHFSEPETQAIEALIENHHFIAGLSYHSYSELILYPYGYADGVIAPDQLALQELAVDMASTIQRQNGGYYTPQAAWELYPCTGTTDDYAYGEHGIFSFTVELANEFIPPANQVQGICDNNIQAAMIMLDRPSHSILKGHITDAATGEPVVAEIYVDGVDNTGVYHLPYESNETFGSYYRLLTNGTYDVTFSAYGYEFVTVENVVITDSDATIVDIIFNSASANIDLTGIVSDAETGLPIENAIVEIQEFGIPSVTTNANGEFLIPGLYEFNYDIIVYSNLYAAHKENIFISDDNSTANFDLNLLDDGTFESGEFGAYWNFEGQNNWVIDNSEVYEGIYSARSGNIGHDEFTAISVSVYLQNDDVISFYRKVSSEDTYDFLKFFVDEELFDQWSGNEGWGEVSYDIPAGFHTFKWSYVKDGGVASGSDCGWIDNITLPSSAFIVTPSILEFLTYEDCDNGLLFSIINISENELTLNDITESGSVFAWYIDDFTLSFPYVLPAGEQIDLLVKVDFPVDPSEEILTDYLFIDSNLGQKTVTLLFDDALYVNADDIPSMEVNKFYGNYPNPFNPSTTFKFSLSTTSNVGLNIYNVKGQLVKTLINEELESGLHSIVWNGDDNNGKMASSGVYFVFVDADNDGLDFTSVKKIILLK